ncbi:large conductance mechanosensitive channel protein MscL [Parasphingorhabdus sp.]|uniref:large conductance mechanosensitive channel protein MscL n=1 Tax=Parasphingorhabdus sp. TaxID=2709688 RepID=UPI0030A36B77
MINEFKAFILKGNVLDLAVAVIIGAAFATITTSLTEDVLMLFVSAIFGVTDLSGMFIFLGSPPADYAALKQAGVPLLGSGQFLSVVINFVILAFILFMIVRYANKVTKKAEVEAEVKAAGPNEIDLLTEIRDSLKK